MNRSVDGVGSEQDRRARPRQPAFKANPYPFYARLRDEAPVWRTTLRDRRTAWLVTRYDDVAGVLKDDTFAKDKANAMDAEQRAKTPWVPGFLKPLERNMLDLDDPDHRRLRALVSKAFTPRLIERLRSRIEALCEGLLDAMEREGGASGAGRSWSPATRCPCPPPSSPNCWGSPRRTTTSSTGGRAGWSRSHPAATCCGSSPPRSRSCATCASSSERRRADPRDDLITALIRAEEAGDKLSEDELLAMAFLLLVAGHETTVNLIASGTLALLEHPEQMEKLRRDPSLIKPAVEELLRYTTPVEMATERYAREDVEIAGTTIPRGELVLAVLGSANRDERAFRGPRRPRPRARSEQAPRLRARRRAPLPGGAARPDGGADRHSALLRRFPGARLAVAPETLRWRRGLFLRGLERLPLVL